MSALAGLFHREQSAARSDLERMGLALEPYGSATPSFWHRGVYGTVHRLMRFTPEDSLERQPLVQGPLCLVADLRLDNRDDLICALGVTSEAARRLPDSALLLSAYQKWGASCVDHLYGAFVFAVWDPRERRLFLARDQLGQKTVFYHHSPDLFAFASAPCGLLALPHVPRRLSETKLAEFLVLNHCDHATTFYEEISRLPPGHTLTVTPKGLQLQRYWKLDISRRVFLPSDDDYVERARELLHAAVRSSLRSAHPVGAMMSGGLDSSTVACTAATMLKARGERLPAFTEVPREGFDSPAPEGRYNDETPLVEAIRALHPTIDLTYVRTEGRSLLDGVDRRSAIRERPVRNAFNVLWVEAIHERARDRGIRVLLTGVSGNLGLSWDGMWQLPELLRRGRWMRLLSELRALRRVEGGTLLGKLKSAALPMLPESLWQRIVKSRQGAKPAWHRYSAIDPAFAAAVAVEARNRAVGHDPGYRLPPDGRAARAWALDGVDYGGDDYSAKTAAFGTEERDPLGDVRLLEYCLAIPQDQFLRKGEKRWLLRRLMRGILPPEVLDNTKSGYQMADWHERLTAARGQIEEEMAALAKSETARRILDLDRMRELIEAWPGGGWHESEKTMAYRLLLARALVVGRFVRWFEGDDL